MQSSRRDFLRTAATGAGAYAVGLVPSPFTILRNRPQQSKLRILVLGGTGFIGPFQVQYALDRGHIVTLFNRGQTNPQLFPGVEKLRGDRANDLKSLEGRTWDVVIDNAESNPDWVELSASMLKNSVKTYSFISSRSVYFNTSRVPMTIDAPLFTRETTPTGMPYGLAKALSEAAVRKHFPGRTLILRPGLIVGPGDLTDRFTYWPVRIERGGEVLSPGDGTDPVQVIDVRDLTEWHIRLFEQGTVGIFNGVGPKNPRSFAELLHGIKAVTTSEATFTWVDADFLAANRVRAYAEMPVWRPARGNFEGFARFDLTREVAAGLTFRPLADTARATLDYYHKQPAAAQATLRAGITPEREKEVLALWKARKPG